MKYAVTGANGYIGRHIVKELLDCGQEVIAIDIRFDDIDERADKVIFSIFEETDHVFEQLGQPDVCIHMAWRNGFVHNDLSHMEDLPKHIQFIKDMVEGGLKQIVVMGSMHEVGYWEGAIDENTPTNPQSLYGIAKNALRQAIDSIIKTDDLCVQWLRGFYILGDDLKNHSIFTKLIEACNAGKTNFPFTTGKNKYDFITVDELAKQIACTAMQTEVQGIINCCSGNPVSLADRVEQFIRENNLDIKLEYGAFPDRPYDSPGIWGDPSKINAIMSNESNALQ